MSYPQKLAVSEKYSDPHIMNLKFEEDAEPLFERRGIVPRPRSANEDEEPRPISKKSGRPTSAKKQTFLNRRNKPLAQKESEGSFLARLKPRQIPMDKERLYEENMALKFQINNTKDEMVRLKTKINQLERELSRKDELIDEFRVTGEKGTTGALQKLHIVSALKNNIKELRGELKAKQTENAKLRKNIKNTRSEELEVEMKTYIDECARLRHHLQEALKDSSQGPIVRNQEERNYQQNVEANLLKKENEELLSQLNSAKEDIRRWREKYLDSEKKKKPKKQDPNLKAEIKKLRALLDGEQQNLRSKEREFEQENSRLYTENRDLKSKLLEYERQIQDLKSQHVSHRPPVTQEIPKQVEPEIPVAKPTPKVIKKPNPPKLFVEIHKVVTQRNMMVGVFLSLLDKNNNGMVDPQEFINGMKANKRKVKLRHIEEVLQIITGKNTGHLPLRLIEKHYDEYDYEGSLPSSSRSTPKQSPIRPKKLENPPKLLVKIYKAAEERKIMIGTFLMLLDKKKSGVFNADEFAGALKSYGCKVKEKYIEEVCKMLNAKNSFTLKALEELCERYSYDKVQSESSSSSPRKLDNPPKLLVKIHKAAKAKNMMIGVFLLMLDKNNNGLFEPEEFTKGLKMYGVNVKQKHVLEVAKMITGSEKGQVPLRSLESLYEKYNYEDYYSSSSSEEAPEEVLIQAEAPVAKPVPVQELAPVQKAVPLKEPADNKDIPRNEAPVQKEPPFKKTEPAVAQQSAPVKEEPKPVKRKEKPPKLFKKMHKAAERKDIDIGAFLGLLDTNKNGVIDPQELKTGMKNQGQKVKDDHISQVNQLITGKKTGPLMLRSLETLYKEYDFSDLSSSESSESSPSPPRVTKEEVQDLLSHISFKMQIHRIAKESMLVSVIKSFSASNLYSKSDLLQIFASEPFSFQRNPSLEKLVQLLLGGQNASSGEFLQRQLNTYLDDWQVFDSQKEDQFDGFLREVIPKNGEQLMKECEKHDTTKTGTVTVSSFLTVLKKIKLDVPPDVFSYMLLLFYSQSFLLDSVPYKHFIEVYAVDEEEDDEEKAAVVRGLLEILADKLKGKTIRGIFKADHEGLITASSFVETLKKVGMEVEDENLLVLMVESLQSEKDTEEMCIDIQELEDIMSHYGVQKADSESDYEAEEFEDSAKHSSHSLEVSEDVKFEPRGKPQKSSSESSIDYEIENSQGYSSVHSSPREETKQVEVPATNNIKPVPEVSSPSSKSSKESVKSSVESPKSSKKSSKKSSDNYDDQFESSSVSSVSSGSI